MMTKKINQKFYTDAKYETYDYNEYMNGPKHLYANGIYKTKLVESDLPDSFLRWTSWWNRYVDINGVVEVYYRANPLIGNNTMKYDYFYISYGKKIEIDEKGIPVDDTYDYMISAVYGDDVIDKLRKYSFVSSVYIDEIEKQYKERVEQVTIVQRQERKQFEDTE